MKMNLTLIALATAAVFDASDIGTSHSVANDAGLSCSALMLKPTDLSYQAVKSYIKSKTGKPKSILSSLPPAEGTDGPLIEVFAYMILKDLLKALPTVAKGWKTANDDALKEILENIVDHSKDMEVPAALKDSVIKKAASYYGELQPSWKNNGDLAKAEKEFSKKFFAEKLAKVPKKASSAVNTLDDRSVNAGADLNAADATSDDSSTSSYYEDDGKKGNIFDDLVM